VYETFVVAYWVAMVILNTINITPINVKRLSILIPSTSLAS
jgi:hypothetical protein